MSEKTNEVVNEVINEGIDVDIPEIEVETKPVVPVENKIVLPTATSFGQTMVNTATTMVAGVIIGAGVNALAAGAGKALGSGAKWVKSKFEDRKQKKALKKAEEEALKELAQEVDPEVEEN